MRERERYLEDQGVDERPGTNPQEKPGLSSFPGLDSVQHPCVPKRDDPGDVGERRLQVVHRVFDRAVAPPRVLLPGGISQFLKGLKTVGPIPGLVGSNPTPFTGTVAQLERWPSGRRRSPAKRVRGVEPLRGFKSLPLRQESRVGLSGGPTGFHGHGLRMA